MLSYNQYGVLETAKEYNWILHMTYFIQKQ